MAHPKSELNDFCQQAGHSQPVYQTHQEGPQHEPVFVSEVIIADVVYGKARGKTKRDAEKEASEQALDVLQGKISLSSVSQTFEGPWPIFPEVLAASFQVANSRVDQKLRGERAITQIQQLALRLYKESLENLGEVIEVDE